MDISILPPLRDLFEEEEDEYNNNDLEVDYYEYSGVNYKEEEEEEEDKEVGDKEEEEEGANHNRYYKDEIEYSDEYNNDYREEERYIGYTDTENKDGYDKREGKYSEDRIDQESLDHDSINKGLEFAYHTERELECVDISLIRYRAQNHYGLLLTSGFILGWRKTKLAGLVVVIGYECRGRRTARVKQYKDLNNRQESMLKDRSLSILGVGLIAWEVDSKSLFEPTKSLYPTLNGIYPTIFITESREDFYSLVGDLSQFEVDILLYFMEGDYLKAMTRKRPIFPVIAST
ncbi:uncharacterized protein N7500_009407 [Penicillium coprophilum]|uniref:uncharacterized protein n=1 Tax=Penicillium coprophilum TaxID=36646 RepID=UPI00239AFACE|nr:uncharacterized protein N7500_009407 [Penicillium coprophilum]KAJ5153968.1 hypothetical protein N7500_009407 [Penicillium coprophilum]